MSNQYMTGNGKKNILNIWDGEEGRTTHKTWHLKPQEKKLEIGIMSTDEMMRTASIPFYFHQSLNQIGFFMLLITNHSTLLRNRIFFIPKLKEFQVLFYQAETKAESGIKSQSTP